MFLWPLFLGTRPFNWTWSQWTNSKIWTQFWEKIAISVCFCCCSAGKRREIGTMNLQIHATLRYWTFSSKGNVHKSSFGLCSRAPGSIKAFHELKGLVPKKQRPQELLATLWFEKRVNLCSNSRFLKKKLKFQLTYGSSNWLSLIAIDFTQSTWFTTSKVNCKNISEFLPKKIPIDFQTPKHFTQLHMIRPQMCLGRK